MVSYLFKIPVLIIAGLWLVLVFLFAAGDAAAVPPYQATPDRGSLTPTASATGAIVTPPGIPVPTQPVSTPQTDNFLYVVQTGDNLWSIATKVYGSGAQYVLIQRANNLPNNAVLRVGSTLIIPSNAQPTEIALTQTPTQKLIPSLTPLPSSTNNPTTPVSTIAETSPTGASPSPTSAEIVSPAPQGSQFSWSPLVPVIQLFMYTLSALSLMFSGICAYWAFESYQRSRLYIRRRYIGNRVRNGL